MTSGEDGDRRALRITLVGGAAGDSDVRALKKWLERELALEAWAEQEKLRIELRADSTDSADARGRPMGAGLEILVVLLTAVSQPFFNDVYDKVKSGVQAWRENRRSVESGDPPEHRIEPVGPTGSAGPAAGSAGPAGSGGPSGPAGPARAAGPPEATDPDADAADRE
ncbi:hypothetical protein ABZ626_16320 [Streptomyces longispororuber]|uniref:hypothetical protein n=1 Tax=Streptomyces longispororuber TaxID=68230 RepID=UPI0033E81BC2